MLLKKLIKNLRKEYNKIKIRGLAINSKKVKKGFIFFAIKGKKINGEKFIFEAIKNGAAAIICSKNYKNKKTEVPIFGVSDVRASLSIIASKFYTLKPKNIIAVTGTNGKTSVADLFYQILNLNNIPAASIGTLGVKYCGKTLKSNLTSPDTIFLHQILQNLKKKKIENVIIETSSHGLHQKRVNNLNFKAGIFTNFSQDHLDYHKTMKAYLKAKLLLFRTILQKKKIIITDKSIKEFPILKKISKKKQFKIIDIKYIKNKLETAGSLKLNEFQFKNLSMAVSAAKLCGLSEKKIFNSLNKIKDINGRLELVKVFPNNIKVFVDFAHTPDALNKTLQALKHSYGQNISLVFGCGGERDFKKRPLMAEVASRNCKKIYVTDDNPRNESPKKIRGEIIKKIKNKNCFNINKRSKAIKSAILNAAPDEIILVAGKGHEREQIYKNKVILTTDRQIIRKIKTRIKKISLTKQNFIQNREILEKVTKKSKNENFHGIAIDSRVVKKDNLFLTIKGKKNNGVKFIPAAMKKGAKFVVSSSKIKKSKSKILKVDDEITFLNTFAKMKRNNSKAKIFAITGSAGKTSLKNLLNDLFKNFGETLCSPKSYNNHYGVPLSLSHLNMKHQFGIFEVGMSRAGEINSLSKLIRPHVGIITNIGEAHIENFKNLKGIAEAKGEIINNIEKNGTIILNYDDKFFEYLSKKSKLKKLDIVSFGFNKKSDVYPIFISQKNKFKILSIKVKDEIVKLEVKNINIYNVLSSLALLKALNLNLKNVTKCFKNLEPSEGRGKIHNINRYQKKFKLIDESYNANPISVKNAIKNFKIIKKINLKNIYCLEICLN